MFSKAHLISSLVYASMKVINWTPTCLGALSPPRTVTSCTANDIVKFPLSKDKSGRAAMNSCPRASCTCPKRLAAGSVDSFMGHLGRLNDSNPVAHPLVKHYLKFVRQEQAGLAITTCSSDLFVFSINFGAL